MSRPTVLFVCHNHPSIRPGGAETYAHELFRAMRSSGEVDAVLLAKGGPPLARSGRNHEGTVVAPAGTDPDEYLYFTDGYRYDWLRHSITDKDFYTRHLRRFLAAVRPDVVHLQHSLFLGVDVLREIRTTLPDAAIVYTLHEYSKLCHRDGQLLRTYDDGLCPGPTPRRCHECFPEISAQDFFLRQRFIRSHLELVDLFVSPSRFLVERYVEWGIPPERIRYEENGRLAPERVAEPGDRPVRDRFGFFGQLTQFKGLDVLLEAMRLLGAGEHRRHDRFRHPLLASGAPAPATDGPRLWVHGANLDMQPGPYQQLVSGLLDATADRVTMVGRYEPHELPHLMEGIDWVVVPSIWFENSPLVIGEAFAHGRPVICSDIGGMAEKVADGVNGLHFTARNPRALAEVMERAATTTGLWDQLRAGIPPVHGMDEHVATLLGWYRELLERSPLREEAHGAVVD